LVSWRSRQGLTGRLQPFTPQCLASASDCVRPVIYRRRMAAGVDTWPWGRPWAA